MKKLLLIILTVLPIFVKAQDTLAIPKLPFDAVNNKYAYKITEQVKAGTQEVLLAKVKEWAAVNLDASSSVVQTSGKDAGKIIVRGKYQSFANYKYMGERPVTYTLDYAIVFLTENGNYSAVINDFTFSTEQDDSMNLAGPAEAKLKALQLYNLSKKYPGRKLKGVMSKRVAAFQIELLKGMDEFAKATLKRIKEAI